MFVILMFIAINQLLFTTVLFCERHTWWKKLLNFPFFNQICLKGLFWVWSKKNGHYHWLQHSWISLGIKFLVNQKILSILSKFAPKGYFLTKTVKVNVTIEYSIFELVQAPSFTLNRQFWFFWTKFAQKV